MIVTLVSAGAAVLHLREPARRPGLSDARLAVGVGCFVHMLGDMITSAGVPIFWPIPIGRRMWRMIGVPDKIAVEVGGKVEVVVLRTVVHHRLGAGRGRRWSLRSVLRALSLDL